MRFTNVNLRCDSNLALQRLQTLTRVYVRRLKEHPGSSERKRIEGKELHLDRQDQAR